MNALSLFLCMLIIFVAVVVGTRREPDTTTQEAIATTITAVCEDTGADYPGFEGAEYYARIFDCEHSIAMIPHVYLETIGYDYTETVS